MRKRVTLAQLVAKFGGGAAPDCFKTSVAVTKLLRKEVLETEMRRQA